MVKWAEFGRHTAYANGAPRSLLRGWAYLALALGGTVSLAAFGASHDGQRLVAQALLYVYWVGAAFHLVPYETRQGYWAALFLDYVGITGAFTVQTVAWCGASGTAGISAACSTAMISTALYALVSGNDVQTTFRALRLCIGSFHVLQLSAVELFLADSIWLGLALVLIKVGAFAYFVKNNEFTGGKAKRGTWPGIWGVHDNFHVLSIIVHALQLFAIGRRGDDAKQSYACLPLA
ncbi:hypothetical protein M885DRAFT_506739 [Pelagophyceae sp. CCMP2097]|nr:hypothetical protein M885DRAFT_506739 [Pelagophyceae sp. CCMP2097]|mmetsp:Transcript_20316/g.68875  ORF Transcript_20316/g.68875 Transcript_20316/m.68875 type:complete len:235 (+) Transcript_20316:95-799(+)